MADTIFRLVDNGFGTETLGYFDSYGKADAFRSAIRNNRPNSWGMGDHLDIQEIGINPVYGEVEIGGGDD